MLNNHQLCKVVDLMAECDDYETFKMFRSIVNRQMNHIKESRFPRSTDYPWKLDMYFSPEAKKAAVKLEQFFRLHQIHKENKITIIKQLRAYSERRNSEGQCIYIRLREAKEFAEKYFVRYFD